MTHTLITLSEDEFIQRYPLLKNHLDPHAAWALGDNAGCLFETPEELDYARRQDPRTVWTLVDGVDGSQCILSGFRVVNRIGYLLSTVPVPEGTNIRVRLSTN